MKDEQKTRQQLLDELRELRQRVAQLESQDAKRESTEEEIYLFMEQTPHAAFIKDPTGRLVYANQRFAEIIGRELQELIGLPSEAFTPAELLAQYEEENRIVLAEGRTLALESTFPGPGGPTHWLTYKFPIYRQGRPSFVGAFSLDITARKRKEQRLHRISQSLQAIINASPLGIVTVDGDGKVTAWSPAAERIFGWTEEEALGRFNPIVPEEEREQFLARLRGASQGEAHFERESRRLRKDGSRVDVKISAASLYDAAGRYAGQLGVIADITERKRMERKLRESKTWLRQIIDLVPHLIFAKDQEGRFLLVNRAGARFADRTIEEMTGTLEAEWVTDEDVLRQIQADDREVMDSGEPKLFLKDRFVDAQGQEHVLQTSKIPFEYRRGAIGVLGVSVDITELTRTEEQLRAALREKRVLLQEVHHRVKNNLQIVSSMLDFQANYIQDQQVIEVLRDSQRRIRSMALIHDQLYRAPDLAQIEFSNYVEMLTTDLFMAFRRDWMRPVAIASDISQVNLDVQQAIPCGLIISELVSNALKHAFPASLRQAEKEREGEIRVALYPTGEGAYELAVSDNGVGLPADLKPLTSETMGMFLVNTFVRQLDGTIEWRSEPGAGTTCRIRFAL